MEESSARTDPSDESQEDFSLASYGVEFEFPPLDDLAVQGAAAAVGREFSASSKWKRLNCRRITVFAERDRGTIYALHVQGTIDFDWTWEGATAFRPATIDEDDAFSDHSYQNAAYADSVLWQGEVLEVDEVSGCLFVTAESPTMLPTVGPFFVRPFQFLSVLNAVYNRPMFDAVRARLRGRLAASLGGIHPPLNPPSKSGLVELLPWWQHAWAILWGPPGTGKTYTTGRQIAAALADTDTSKESAERFLVISTTNRATDALALSIGSAAESLQLSLLDQGRIRRIGRGYSRQAFESAGLTALLPSDDAHDKSEHASQIEELSQQLVTSDSGEDRALTRKQLATLKSARTDPSKRVFFDANIRTVAATAFKAMAILEDPTTIRMLENDLAPFTTIFIDEAGLMPRAAIAALSLLASRRVVLVGDSKQLAPISRISRLLPSRQQTWLASSGLSHLDDLRDPRPAVHVLSEQHRMHPDVCNVVSRFQYGGSLTTAPTAQQRLSTLPTSIAQHGRAIWYVLDAETDDLPSIRAKRGPGNKSWLRTVTSGILAKLFSNPETRELRGLYIAPYKAQAQLVSRLLGKWKIPHWQSSTVHSQQGSEADLVIFDTVNASSYNWPFDEWKRLVNVALSRAREGVIVIASRSEMEEPYLKPLLPFLTPSVLVQHDDSVAAWTTVNPAVNPAVNATAAKVHPPQAGLSVVAESAPKYQTLSKSPQTMGEQIASRQSLKPILSQEQQRLSNLRLDGKPRLVRGVAGSGKSMVMCHWLAKTVRRLERARTAERNTFQVWAIYANRSLHKLLRESIESAWQELCSGELFEHQEFPWDRVSLLHVRDVFAGILPNASMTIDDYDFDYDRAAEEFLNRADASELLPTCSALFVDEAQDMGPSTLRLLLSVVEQTDTSDRNSRSAHIFFDNAQNIYGCKTPSWSEFGLDMRGRSSVMRESFRATLPINELATNVLHRLTATDVDHADEHKEMIEQGLVTPLKRDGEPWLQVRFNQIEGPKPIFHQFNERQEEMKAIARHLRYLIQTDKILPRDICIIYNGKAVVENLQRVLAPLMKQIDVDLSVQTNRPFERHDNTLVVTTAHSYKGYESEVVLIPGVDAFVARNNQILAKSLYVAITRARSLLAIYGSHNDSTAAQKLMETLAKCVACI